MKLTEQVEAEIRKVMDDYWSSYFEGNLDHWATYLADDYRNIGGTEEEIWNSKKEILDYTFRIIDQMKGVTELRNKQVQLIPYDPYMMVHELLDIYIKVEEEWTFYQKFRLSSLIQKTHEGWKVLHQQGSYPDSKTTEGEAFAFDTLKSENLKLQKAISERTIELEAKNRELEIETAVEKVRAQSLGMYQTSDFSKVTKEVYEQLNHLQIEGFTGVSIYQVDENDMVRVWDLSSPGNLANAIGYTISYDAKKYPVFGSWVDPWRTSTEEYLLFDFPLDQLKAGVKELKEILPEMAALLADAIESGNLKHQWNPSGRFSDGILSVDLIKPPTEDVKNVVCKMAGAFNLAYQRFLDLKKSEAQTREAKIETALEKVRAVAMSMHKQDDMLGICKALFDELRSLGFAELRNALIHSYVDEETYFIDYDYSDVTSGNISRIPYTGNIVIEKFIKSIRKSSDGFFEHTLRKKELQDWIAFRKQNNEADDPRLENIKSLHYYNYSVGTSGIGISTYEPITKEQQGVFERFKNVFQLAYQRYSDISWAEAQAREAQTEAALERVRSRTMAMHKTSELQEVIHTVHKELMNLGVSIEGGSFVVINDEVEPELRCWGSGGTADTSEEVQVPHFNMPFCTDLVNGIKIGPAFFTEEFSQKEKVEYFTKLFERKPWSDLSEHDKKETLTSAGGYTRSVAVSKHTSIFIINQNGRRFTEPENEALKRFANVFEQTYTRFLDLQKAEAQAREAQIEAALEKVRSRSLAMHKSDEIGEVVCTVVEKMKELNIEMGGISLVTFIPNSKDLQHWYVNPDVVGNSSAMLMSYFDNLVFNDAVEAKEKGMELLVKVYSKEEKNTYLQAAFENSDFRYFPDEIKQWILDQPYLSFSYAIQKHSGIYLEDYTGKLFSNEENNILIRFSKVFEQSYVRFLDLQKAEAQAREAQINLAVERVRARALAMFKSEEILEVVFKLKEEVMNLNIPNVMAATIHMIEKNGKHRMWDISSMEAIEGKLHLPLDISYHLEETDLNLFIRRVWDETARYFLVTQDEKDLKRTTQWVRDNGKIKEADEAEEFIKATGLKKLYHPTIQLNNGRMSIDLLQPPSPEIEAILTKMGAAFDLAYTRFEDLKNSEAQLKEAGIELALERVRSQAMAMNTSSDLLDIVVTMRNEFTRLGYEAQYFWHMMWLTDRYEKAMTSGDGSKIGFVMNLPRHIHGNIPLLAKWEKTKKPTVVYAMDVEEAIDYVEKMISLGDFKSIDPQAPTYEDIRHIGGLTFVMARTTHGEIGYSLPGVVENPPKEDVDVLIRLAGAFDIAHRRFLDLQQAEAQSLQIRQEKERLEVALIDLRATQSQLIQSEKMASLGELTAGIAHEIQNPLNFVNNFSEVSKELIDEMRQELENGDIGEAKAIAHDIQENLSKINHHGKRADAIVKGMLQHSRSSTDKKEPTDINALCDEYLRLTYHGVRAKDKSFNAKLVTEFDAGIGSIDLIPQDIGRVLLNLLNNAFYAVDEKKKTGIENYEPTVSISTKKRINKIEISVSDNGNGIPQKALNKIFQPFFTTKPTGQGTGLGLSLSYDSIKAHGGELKVETKEGQGTIFFITLIAI